MNWTPVITLGAIAAIVGSIVALNLSIHEPARPIERVGLGDVASYPPLQRGH